MLFEILEQELTLTLGSADRSARVLDADDKKNIIIKSGDFARSLCFTPRVVASLR
jgi:hypothetical protein